MNVTPFMPQERDRLPTFRHEVRNRPHPNKAFLYWKQPRSDPAPPSKIVYTNDIAETFYQDYSRRGVPSEQKYGDRDETLSVPVNPWRKPLVNSYYDGTALNPLRTISRLSNASRIDRPISRSQYKQTTINNFEELRETPRKPPMWSSNLIEMDSVRNQSRQMRSRLSIRPESVQQTVYVPKEISDFTSWLQTSEPTQRIQFLDYLRSLTTVLEDSEINTNTNSTRQTVNGRVACKKQPILSYQTQSRINKQKNAKKAAEFVDSLEGGGIEIQKFIP